MSIEAVAKLSKMKELYPQITGCDMPIRGQLKWCAQLVAHLFSA
jgi:hypothetical protein